MDNKQINRDWTLKESSKLPRKNNVVIDVEGNLGVVVKTAGDMVKREIWVEDENGQEIHTKEKPEHFRFANHEQTRSFYLNYKKNKGWEIGKVYSLRGKDYPLLLEDLEYDLSHQDMMYVFRDLNESTPKFFRTLDESLIEHVQPWEQEAVLGSFVKDLTSRLDHDVEVNIRVNPEFSAGWSVSGRSFSFDSEFHADQEIKKWIDRMRVRRVASVLQTVKKGELSQISLSEDGNLYVSPFKENNGQPAVFISRVAAALALIFLGEDIWRNSLEIHMDKYDI